jgi:2-polyprenyl-3-methyl-5-hydroxy-6-metoxy-1,4-benzoquinol methylase
LSAEAIQFVEVPCPICGSSNRRVVSQFADWTYGIGGPYQSVRCLHCRHLYLNPRTTDETLLRCYPQQYGPHHLESVADTSNSQLPLATENRADADSTKKLQALRKLWRRWLDNRSTWMPAFKVVSKNESRRALEIGCADGWFCQKLAEDGWDVQGIEPVAAAAERARARGLTVHTGTVHDVFVPSQSIDFVAAWMVLEHLPSPGESVQQISKWIKPGGVFAFSVPNAASVDRYLFGRHWSGYDGGRHLQFYTPRLLGTLLAKGDLRMERVIHQNTIQPIVGSLGSVMNSLVPRSRLAKRMSEVYMNEVSFRTRVLCSPLANLIAGLYLSSRITVIARKNS